MASVSATSPEICKILEYLQWNDVAFSLDEFVDRFTLPQIVKVQEEIENNSCTHVRQLLTLHAVESTEKVLARDRKDREMHLPLNCANRIELRPQSFRGVCEKVEYLRGFKFVRVTQGYVSLDDESCTISPGDKLEVIGEEEGSEARESCLVFQNQVQSTIRLPFSVSAGFQPLVDGREYTLMDVRTMELPVYFQFIDPPDPIGQEPVTGVFNCTLGVLKFEKTYRDSIVISTAMRGCANTAVVYPKLVSMKVLRTLDEDEKYGQICRMFHDRISLSKVSHKELENVHASRNTIREYQECIETGFAFLAEKSIDEGITSSPAKEVLNGTEPATKGSGDPGVMIETPDFSSPQQQEAEKISDECHDTVSPQRSLTDEHSDVTKSETGHTEYEAPSGFSFGASYHVLGVTETATDDDGSLDLTHQTYSTDRLSDEAVQLENHVERHVHKCDDQIIDSQQQRPFVGEQPYITEQSASARRTGEDDEDTKIVTATEVKCATPLGKKVARLDHNGDQIDNPEQEEVNYEEDYQGLSTSHKKQPPPVKEKPKRKTSTPEKSQFSSIEPQPPIHGSSPTQQILKERTSAPVVRSMQSPDCTGRMVNETETRGLPVRPERPKKKPPLAKKPSAEILRAREGVKLPRQGPSAVKPIPVLREPSPPAVNESRDAQLESGCSSTEATSLTKTAPSSTSIRSLPVKTDYNEEGRSLAVETDDDHLDGYSVETIATNAEQHLSIKTKSVDQRLMEIVANPSEINDAKEPGAEKQPKPLPRHQAPQTKPKPTPRPRFLSHPVAETEASSLEQNGATSLPRQPPPVKPKPLYKRSSLPLN